MYKNQTYLTVGLLMLNNSVGFFFMNFLNFFFLEYIRPLWHCWKQRTKHRRLASSWEVIIMNINLICLSVYNEIKSSFDCYHLNLGNVLHVHNEYKTRICSINCFISYFSDWVCKYQVHYNKVISSLLQFYLF